MCGQYGSLVKIPGNVGHVIMYLPDYSYNDDLLVVGLYLCSNPAVICIYWSAHYMIWAINSVDKCLFD